MEHSPKCKQLDVSQLEPDLPKLDTTTLTSQGQWRANQPPNFSLKATLHSENNNVDIDASHHQQWQIQWRANLPSIARFSPWLSGHISTAGSLHGKLRNPTSSGWIKASQLHWHNGHAAQLNGNWQWFSQQSKKSQLTLTAAQVSAGNYHANQITAGIQGNLSHQQLNAAVNTDGLTSQFQLQGKFTHDLWQGKLTQLDVSLHGIGTFALTRPSTMTIGQNQFSLSRSCLTDGQRGKLCLTANWQRDQAWRIQANARSLNLLLLKRYFEPEMKLTGSMNGAFLAQGNTDNLQQAKLTINLTPGTLHYYAGKKALLSRYRGGQILANFVDHQFQGRFNLNLPGKEYFTATFTLPNYSGQGLPSPQQAIQGNVETNLTSTGLISALFPSVIIPKGTLRTNLAMSGTLADPILTGNAQLLNGNIRIPILNLTLTNVDFSLQAKKQIIDFGIDALSTGKPLHISGETNLRQAGFPTKAHVTGKNILIINTPEYKIHATPDVTAKLIGQNLELTGSIFLPKALIKPQDFRDVVTLPAGEVSYVGQPPLKSTNPLQIGMKLNITVGKDVQLDLAGIRGIINGSVVFAKQPKQTLLVTGRLGVTKGTYSTYGHTLTITPSSFVQYTNAPLTNPTMSMQATRSVMITSLSTISQLQQITDNKYVVGVDVHGTFRHPKITLFSQPANLSQADILSYLVLGETSSPNTSGQLAIVMRALDALKLGSEGLTKTGGVIQQIQKGLGFSELGFETETTVDAIGNPIDQQTAFVIGKHLTRRLYLRYAQALDSAPGLTNTNQFTLQYLLGRHWTLQATNAFGNNDSDFGGDILYTTEK